MNKDSVFPSDADRPEGDVTSPTNAVVPGADGVWPSDGDHEATDGTPAPSDGTGAEQPVFPEGESED